jgi:hypothetical protein
LDAPETWSLPALDGDGSDVDGVTKTVQGLSDDDNDDDDAKTVRGIEPAGSGASTRSVSPGVSTGQYDCYIGKTDSSIAEISCGRQHHERQSQEVKSLSSSSVTRRDSFPHDEVL